MVFGSMRFCSEHGYFLGVKLTCRQHVMIHVETVIGGMAMERVTSRANEWEEDVLKHHNLLRKA